MSELDYLRLPQREMGVEHGSVHRSVRQDLLLARNSRQLPKASIVGIAPQPPIACQPIQRPFTRNERGRGCLGHDLLLQWPPQSVV